MGNNRSNLISGSTATTASLNSTSSLPVNPMSVGTNSLQPQMNGSQSSVSFLKRFRNTNPSGHNCDELDQIDSNPAHRKKNKKLNTFTKKLKKPDSVDDFTSETNKKSTAIISNQKRIDKNKMISLSTSNITKNSKVSTNESEYTTINEYVGDSTSSTAPLKPSGNKRTHQPIISHIKEESFYESTFDMDLPNATSPPQTLNTEINKENEQIDHVKRASKILAACPTDKTNTNIYSEIVNKTSVSKTLPHHTAASGYSGQQPSPPSNPPPQASNNGPNKKNHLQPITNFFNKLTKTTKQTSDSVPSEVQPPVAQAPVIPTKAFNPTKEFYSYEFNSDAKKRFDDDEIEDEEDEDDGGIYSKIDKSSSNNIRTSDNIGVKTNIPPLPTTLVPSTLLTDEIESCLKLKSNSQNYCEYQSVQEYDYIEKPVSNSPVQKAILYTPIEPLNINNQVYYSFASDSQEQFDLQNEYISRIDVKPNSAKLNDIKKFTLSLNESDISLKECKQLNLINEIQNSRSQIEASNNYTVKL